MRGSTQVDVLAGVVYIHMFRMQEGVPGMYCNKEQEGNYGM
jgi:hypothetical protein